MFALFCCNSSGLAFTNCSFRNNLSTEEVEFITEYDKLLTDYMLEVDVEGLTSVTIQLLK